MKQAAQPGHSQLNAGAVRGPAIVGAFAVLLICLIGASLASAQGGVAPPSAPPPAPASGSSSDPGVTDPGTDPGTPDPTPTDPDPVDPAPEPASYENVRFGSRDLALGMRGEDVKILNWLLKYQVNFDRGVPFEGEFVTPTEKSVRDFQSASALSDTGVVESATRSALKRTMRKAYATWYGPGFWGNRTGCGKRLKKTTIGVAHKTLPCGTKVTFAYGGRFVRAKVIDRGPYNGHYQWDLTKKLAKRLGFLSAGTGRVRAAVIHPSV